MRISCAILRHDEIRDRPRARTSDETAAVPKKYPVPDRAMTIIAVIQHTHETGSGASRIRSRVGSLSTASTPSGRFVKQSRPSQGYFTPVKEQ